MIIGSSEAIGGIKDISLDGLAFTYDPIRGQSFEEIPIDRLTIDCPGFRLTDIACSKKSKHFFKVRE